MTLAKSKASGSSFFREFRMEMCPCAGTLEPMPDPDIHVLLQGNLGAMIRDERRSFSFGGIAGASFGHLRIRLVIQLLGNGIDEPRTGLYEIVAYRAVDYSIRPMNPSIMSGGPPLAYHEEHPLLNTPGLQAEPGRDGECFDPPLKLAVLILDQSYIIAEEFQITERGAC